MTDYAVHDSLPDYDDLDEKVCQYRGCDRLPTHVTKFHAPDEYIVYCSEHAYDALTDTGGKSVRTI